MMLNERDLQSVEWNFHLHLMIVMHDRNLIQRLNEDYYWKYLTSQDYVKFLDLIKRKERFSLRIKNFNFYNQLNRLNYTINSISVSIVIDEVNEYQSDDYVK